MRQSEFFGGADGDVSSRFTTSRVPTLSHTWSGRCDTAICPVSGVKQKSLALAQVRFVEVLDPLTQHLLELYASMEWDLPLEEFDTH
jgi:hypothetical protein